MFEDSSNDSGKNLVKGIDRIVQSAHRLAARGGWKLGLPALLINKKTCMPGGSTNPEKVGGFYEWADEGGHLDAFDGNTYALVVEFQNLVFVHLNDLLA